jgi:3-dehydroquinate synthase
LPNDQRRSADVEVVGYRATVAAGAIDDVGPVCTTVARAHTYAVITDEHVAPHWLRRVLESLERAAPDSVAVTHAIVAGEAQKTRETWMLLTDWMLSAGCGRDTTVVALGGGVVGDLAGFVAATYMRGVPVVQVPTSLLAMVDAAIGGKTGVDTVAGKNLVGAFHHPAAVLIDPCTLNTLAPAHVRAGMAEVLKHGAIADAAYFDDAAELAARAHRALQAADPFPWDTAEVSTLIARSVDIKADVVRRDEREAGHRQILNAGHTVAHAIELVTEYRGLHGEAVAVGLVAEARIAERAGIARSGTAARLASALGAGGLPTALPFGIGAEALVAAMRTDKKARGGRVAFALLSEVGKAAGSDGAGWTTFIDGDVVRAVLEELTQSDESPVGTPVA